jgi:tetratricopeptide (TPR) repeat protein
MSPEMIRRKPRVILKSNFIVWIPVFPLVIFSLLSSFHYFGSNLVHLRLVKSFPVSPYSCTISSVACDALWTSFELGLQDKVAYYLKDDPIRLLAFYTSQYTEVDNDEHLLENGSDRVDFVWLALGATAYHHGGVNQAVEYWKNVPQISYYLINLSNQLKSPAQAIQLLELSIKVKPTDLGYYEMGMKFSENDEDEKALAAYDQALKWAVVDRNADLHAKIYLRKGEIYLRQGNGKKAQESFESALDLQGNLLPGDTIKLARSYIQLGRLDVARSMLEELLKSREDIVRAWWWLGEVERMSGNTDRAIYAYNRYKELNPKDARVDKRIEKLESGR